MKKIYIYALVEPQNENEIRYVGQSKNPYARYLNHIAESKKKNSLSHKNNWIKSLILNGQKPKLIILDEVDDNNWELFEKYWISQCKAWGFCLTNGNDGGISLGEYSAEDSKEKMLLAKFKRCYNGENNTFEYALWKELTRTKKENRKLIKIREKDYWKTDKYKTTYKMMSFNADNGMFIRYYDGPSDCAKDLNTTSKKIVECLSLHKGVAGTQKNKNGKTYIRRRISHKGKIFVYVKDYDIRQIYSTQALKITYGTT